MKNAYATAAAQLGITQAVYDAAKAAVVAYLQANPDKVTIPDVAVIATHAALVNPLVFNQIKSDLGG